MSIAAKRIHDRRVALNMSVDTLAARIGKNRATVYRYESAEIENLPISVIPPIAEALNCTPAYLMGWSDEKPEAPKDPAVMELEEVFADLTDENRGKLLEIAHLYLNSQK